MRYLSVCSGIEAATLAWHNLGWDPVAFSEIEPFPCKVLAHHYPHVPNYGDMTKFKEWPIEPGSIDLLVGGTPCQSFSVAGLRRGLEDPRGNLMLTFGAIAGHLKPTWIVWENVPGVLSSHEGRDFGSFLGMLGELGYGFAYRVLDAQFFGVPQRRRRVFVVGHLRDWRRAAAVLFESESLCGYPPPSRKEGKEIAHALRARANASHREDSDNYIAHTLRSRRFNGGEDGTGRGTPIIPVRTFDMRGRGDGETVNTLCTDHASRPSDFCPVVAFGWQNSSSQGLSDSVDVTPTLDKSKVPAISASAVRRLTPLECERLQGFPDDWTLIPWGRKMGEKGLAVYGKLAPDGPRYKAIGNSMAVPVMRWIGHRIEMVKDHDPMP